LIEIYLDRCRTYNITREWST